MEVQEDLVLAVVEAVLEHLVVSVQQSDKVVLVE
jgi:hypothetical protein